MQPIIELTDTMLNKHIIDCNKSIREFIYKHFGIKYKDDLEHLKNLNNTYTIYNSEGVNKSYTLCCDIDSQDPTECPTPSHVKFYMTKRGDKRLSIKFIKRLAKVGDIITFDYCERDDIKGGKYLYLTVYK
jgi:hypothetical protein